MRAERYPLFILAAGAGSGRRRVSQRFNAAKIFKEAAVSGGFPLEEHAVPGSCFQHPLSERGSGGFCGVGYRMVGVGGTSVGLVGGR